MRVLVIAAAAVALCACATVGDLRAKGPAETFTSTKAPATLNECVTAAWNEVKVAGSPSVVRQQHVGDVYSVLIGPSNVVEMADISPAGNGSAVKFYHSNGEIAWRTAHFTDALKPCL